MRMYGGQDQGHEHITSVCAQDTMASAAARTVASEAAKEGPKGTFKEGEGVPPAR